MRFLGSGSCSIVFALSPDEAAEIAPDAPPALCDNAALRITIDAAAASCPTCLSALRGAVGDSHTVQLSHVWRARCAEAHPSAAAYCNAPRAMAQVTTNFASAPARLAAQGAAVRQWIAMEVKPKAAWRPPRVVGIAVDGVDYYLHPVKLRQCRFSLMQLRKREKGSAANSGYCPNELFFADSVDSMATALSSLWRDPANNIRLLAEGGLPSGPERVHFYVFAAALRCVGILSVLASLQLHGTNSALGEEAIDIELLYRWSTARDASSVRWIVCDATPRETVRCACQSPTPLHRGAAERDLDKGKRYIPPPLSFGKCMDIFYASTTAKDVSLIISASMGAQTPVGVAPQLLESAPNSSCVGLMASFGTDHADATLCRIGVVDLDSKRKKSLQHYYDLDQEILAAWERQRGSSTEF